MNFYNRVICVFLAFVCLFSAIMTGTLAWRDVSQHKSNEFKGAKPTETSHAVLEKRDRETGEALSGAVFELYKTEKTGEAVFIGRYVTDENGRIQANRLAAGSYFWLETDPPYGYAFDKNSEGDEITRYPFTLKKDESGVLRPVTIYAYNNRLYADLTLSKTAENEDGSGLTEEQLNIKFEFTISFASLADGPVTVIIDGEENEFIIHNSQFTIELKHGQIASIKNLPVGTLYTISEKPVDGWSVSAENYQGGIPPGGIAAAFVNRRGGEEAEKLIVKKTVTGDGADLNKEFSFTVTIDGEETRFSLKHGEEREFPLPIGAVFEVREDNYLDEGYEPSASITIYTDENGVRVAEVRQRNHYTGPVLIVIEGEKTWDLSGTDANLPESITIILKDGSGVAATATVRPGEDGRWRYRFSVPKYRSDGSEITYTVEEIAVPGFTSVVSGYDIHNIYRPSATVIVPAVKKSVLGNPPAALTFSFRLAAINNAPMPPGSVNGERIITINGAGEAGFGQIVYSNAGTYRYNIIEINTGEPGWSFDKTMYILTVTVREEDGRLTAEKSLAKADGTPAGETAAFTNIYHEEQTTTAPPDTTRPPETTTAPPDTTRPPETTVTTPDTTRPPEITASPPGTTLPPKKPERPVTGDNSNVWLWAVLMVSSAFALRFLLLYKKPRK